MHDEPDSCQCACSGRLGPYRPGRMLAAACSCAEVLQRVVRSDSHAAAAGAGHGAEGVCVDILSAASFTANPSAIPALMVVVRLSALAVTDALLACARHCHAAHTPTAGHISTGKRGNGHYRILSTTFTLAGVVGGTHARRVPDGGDGTAELCSVWCQGPAGVATPSGLLEGCVCQFWGCRKRS